MSDTEVGNAGGDEAYGVIAVVAAVAAVLLFGIIGLCCYQRYVSRVLAEKEAEKAAKAGGAAVVSVPPASAAKEVNEDDV